MQNAVINFAKSKENGLCLIDMPTGTGKTYQTRCLIKKYIEGKELTNIPLIIYLTPLKKNVDEIYNELRNDFENKELFDNNVLRLRSYSDCVLDNFSKVKDQIPYSLKRKDSFRILDAKIKQIREIKDNNLIAYELKELKDYENKFRRDLEDELNKSSKRKTEKKKLINHEYSWVKELYPSCLTEDRKVLFMTMDKFLYGNDPIISNSYKFLSYSKVKNALIFIDEFDSTKDVILKAEIQKCTDYKIDLVKLFIGITLALQGRQMPKDMFANSEKSEKAFKEMSKRFLGICKQYNLDYLFKLESHDNKERYFLFDDYKIHTIGGNDKENSISSINDKNKKQNTLKIGPKGNEIFYQTIYGMKYAVNSFIYCCSTMASEYLNAYNRKAVKENNDKIEIDQAVSSIVNPFNLDENIEKTVSSLIIDNIALPIGAKKRDIFSTDFYMNGFRYFDLNDDVSHNLSTTLSTCYLNSTPEKFMISLTNKARVVGLSATASLNSVTSNYNLEYIKKKIDNFYELPEDDKDEIRKKVQEQLYCTYKIEPEGMFIESGDEPENIASEVFSNKCNIEFFTNLLQKTVGNDENKNPNYNNNRFAKILLSIKKFLENKNSHVLLVLANRNVHSFVENDPYNTNNINVLVPLICKELEVDNPKLYFLFGENFEQEKNNYMEEVGSSGKVILFSSYPSVGTGQNLQYQLENNDEEKEEKDIDSLYLEYPTNTIIHVDYLNEEANLNKFIYQIEALKFNGEIDPFKAMTYLKLGFKKYLNPNRKCGYLDKQVYASDSINNHRIKILIQAVGRICRTRTKSKNHEVKIYVDNDILSQIDFNILNGRMLNSEFNEIVKLSNIEGHKDNETIMHLNKARDADNRVETRIGNILSKNKTEWDEKDMKQWDLIRDFVLKHPTISRQELKDFEKEPGLNSIEDFYLFNKDNIKFNSYIYNREDNKRISYKKEPNQKPGAIYINEQNSRLTILMKNSVVRKYFEDHGYATSFVENEAMILPVVYQNIYKGAIGEQAGVAILKNQGIPLVPIEDPKKFEKFDFCYEKNKDIYFDLKNWSENDKEDRNENDEKAEDKLNKIAGKKVFIINLFSSQFEIHERGNVVEISSLYNLSNNNYQLNMEDMHRILSKIWEADNYGNK